MKSSVLTRVGPKFLSLLLSGRLKNLTSVCDKFTLTPASSKEIFSGKIWIKELLKGLNSMNRLVGRDGGRVVSVIA